MKLLSAQSFMGDNNMKCVLKISVFGLLFPLAAGATTLEQQQVVIRDCERVLENAEVGQETRDYFISRITSWEEIFVQTDDAVACLRAMSRSDDWNYDPRTEGFVQGGDVEEYRRQVANRISELREVVADAETVLAANQTYEQQRAAAFLQQTIQECSDWYEDDRRAALTNPICYEVFSEIGVPLDPPTGLTASLVNQARQQKLDAQNELDQLLETGRLPRITWQFEDLSNQISGR